MRGRTPRRTRRSCVHRSDRSWTAAPPTWRSGAPDWDRRSPPPRRPRAAMPPSSSHSSRRPSAVLAKGASAPNRIAASIFPFATSMPTIVPFCAILQLPSLLVRAQGPCNCSGLGRHRICPSLHYRLHALGTYGLRSGDGRLLEAVARSHILAKPTYTRDLFISAPL